MGLIILLLIFALVAAVLGFGVLADAAATIAVILFAIFAVLLLASVIARVVRG